MKHLILLLIFSLGTISTYAQSINKDDLEKKIDSIFYAIDNKNSPGCAVTIIHNDEVMVKKSYGMASIELGVPFTHESMLKIPYSEAREFISIAAILMENDGLLSLNDKVRKYFPKLPDWAASVTIWDLLNHRSGFVDEWATLLLMQNSMSNRFEKEQFLQLLYKQPIPQIEPCKGYLYSNSDFGLLRLIMEKASGENLPDWMRLRMLVPLKMEHSKMQKSPLEIIPNRSNLYENSIDGSYEIAQVPKTSPGGDYYILTTADDLVHWIKAIKNPTSEISQAAIKLMNSTRQIPGKENHYTIGYSKKYIGKTEVIAHEGVNGYNYISRIPEIGIDIITLGNRNGDGFAEENQKIINYLLNVSEPTFPKLITKSIELSEQELVKFEGNYLWQSQTSWEGYRQTRKFSTFFIDEGKLKVRYTGNYVIPLTPVAEDMFYFQEDFGVQFEFENEIGISPTKVNVIYDDGFPGVEMVKDTSVVWLPNKSELEGFIGKYYSKHLDYFWNIDINHEGEIILKRNTLPDIELKPDGLNQFHFIAEKYPGVGFDQWILFNTGINGKVNGLTVWSSRVMHHEFVRVKE